jgi:ferredoxin-type protein NapH
MQHHPVTLKSITNSLVPGFIFWTLAIVLYIKTGHTFFLFNFSYIGTSLSIGIFLYIHLPDSQKHWGRKLSQFLIGIYLFLFLGVFLKLNIQIEGVWFEILFGVSTAPLMHYLVAKLFGPLLFGRLYCGWACWTTMILDLLPFGNSTARTGRYTGHLRYIHFTVTLFIVIMAWSVFKYNDLIYFASSNTPDKAAFVSNISLAWFIFGNTLYYISGIILAWKLKDNRAFCKYLCPITVFFKAGTRFSIMKIKGDKEKCTNCGSCSNACLMNIDIPGYILKGKRVLSTECVLCLTCTNTCPEKNLKLGFGMDCGIKERLIRK